MKTQQKRRLSRIALFAAGFVTLVVLCAAAVSAFQGRGGEHPSGHPRSLLLTESELPDDLVNRRISEASGENQESISWVKQTDYNPPVCKDLTLESLTGPQVEQHDAAVEGELGHMPVVLTVATGLGQNALDLAVRSVTGECAQIDHTRTIEGVESVQRMQTSILGKPEWMGESAGSALYVMKASAWSPERFEGWRDRSFTLRGVVVAGNYTVSVSATARDPNGLYDEFPADRQDQVLQLLHDQLAKVEHATQGDG